MAVRRRSVTGAEKEAVWEHEERRKGERKRRQETWRIWSAKCEEFSRVAFTVTSIDTADIYYEKGVGGGVDPVYFRRPEDRESFVPRRHTPRRDTSSHDTDESCTAALRNPYTL